MKFPPYHNFAGCAALEKSIRAVINAGHATPAAEAGFNRFHYSLVHKLRSAYWHVSTLTSSLQQVPADRPFTEVAYRANFHFDGFCYCVGSAKDIFAHEVLSYLGLQIPAKTYFYTAREQVAANRPQDAILPFLEKPGWLSEFNDYRNTATHECVVTNSGTIQIVLRGQQEERKMTIPLPADPRDPQSGVGHDDVVKYCETTFRRTVSLFNQAYNHLAARVRAAGAVPI